MVELGLPHLSKFLFALAGQKYAQRTMVKEVVLRLATQETYRRMVFLLGGPPWHGKTMAAKELCKVLGSKTPEEDFLKISCANVNSVIELFGASGAYSSSDVGSELNNFIVNHRNSIGVVNLDEFDRLKPEVRDGLFTIFDKGEWINKKLCAAFQTKTLDCKRIIWVLTTNVFDDEIVSFYKKERECFEKKQWKRIDSKAKTRFRNSIRSNFGDPMSRRITSIIPFVPFVRDDCIAFVEEEIDNWRDSFRKPPIRKNDKKGPTRLVGNFMFVVDPEVVDYICTMYMECEGATSLKDFIEMEIVDRINESHIVEGNKLDDTTGKVLLTGGKGEEEIQFQWPAK